MSGPQGYDKHLRIPSRTSEGQRVVDEIVQSLENAGFSTKELFGIKLAIEEALVNSIKHGNQLDPEKHVDVMFSVTDECFAIEIHDQGEGFNMDDIPDPTDPENLERPTGRGLFLMHAYMTECHFVPPGNVCRMKRNRT